MKSTRRSQRNHHDGHHDPGDPLGVYMPPLDQWQSSKDESNYTQFKWVHPKLGWIFTVGYSAFFQHGNFRRESGYRADVVVNVRGRSRKSVTVATLPTYDGRFSRGGFVFDGQPMTNHRSEPTIAIDDGRRTIEDAYNAARKWYSGVAYSGPGVDRLSERNPDWSEVREKASHYAGRAAAGARSAYDWTAPRARAAYDWTAPRARAAGHAAWEGTKAAGRAVKRGAKRAAPVIARGAKSAAERMDRWAAEPNGRRAAKPKSLSVADIAAIKRVSPTIPTSQYAKVLRLSVGSAEVSRPSYDGHGRGKIAVDTDSMRYLVPLRAGDSVIAIPRR